MRLLGIHPAQHRLPPHLMHHHRCQMQCHQSRQQSAQHVMQLMELQQRDFRMDELRQWHQRHQHDGVAHHQHACDQYTGHRCVYGLVGCAGESLLRCSVKEARAAFEGQPEAPGEERDEEAGQLGIDGLNPLAKRILCVQHRNTEAAERGPEDDRGRQPMQENSGFGVGIRFIRGVRK